MTLGGELGVQLLGASSGNGGGVVKSSVSVACYLL